MATSVFVQGGLNKEAESERLLRSIVIGYGTAALPIQVDGVLKEVFHMPNL